MAGTVKILCGPGHLSSAAGTNLVAGLGTAAANPIAGTYNIVRHIHLFNEDTAARTVTIFLGATGGTLSNTALLYTLSIAAATGYDLYGAWKMTTAEFLSGQASINAVVTQTVTGEAFAL
jgi:hypothetical protein